MTGSFRPLDAHEWAVQAYVRAQERLVAAEAADDIPTLKALVREIQQLQESDDVDPPVKAGDSGEDPLELNARDCTGRTPLHVAILAGAQGAALELIEVCHIFGSFLDAAILTF